MSDGFEIAPRQRFILQGLTTLVLIITILMNQYTNHELLAEGVLQDQGSLPIDTVTVHKVSFSGNSVVAHSQFSEVVQPYTNRPLTLGKLDEMAKAVTAAPLSCHVCPYEFIREGTVIDLGVPRYGSRAA